MNESLKWNCSNFNEDITFRTDFFAFIAISHARFLATTLDDNVSRIRRRDSLMLLLVAYWDLHHANFDWRWSRRFFVVSFSKSALTKSASFFRNSTELRFFDFELYCIRAISWSSKKFWSHHLSEISNCYCMTWISKSHFE